MDLYKSIVFDLSFSKIKLLFFIPNIDVKINNIYFRDFCKKKIKASHINIISYEGHLGDHLTFQPTHNSRGENQLLFFFNFRVIKNKEIILRIKNRKLLFYVD